MARDTATKTDRELEDKMLAFAADKERVHVIGRARAFKRSWIELAEALCVVVERGSYQRWGYSSFDSYCKKELHVTPATAAKLLGSFRFLKSTAPSVIERAHSDDMAPIPDIRAVDFVARAEERGAADDETLRAMRRDALEEGAAMPLLSRRYKTIAFPVSRQEASDKTLGQIAMVAKRLAALLAEVDGVVPHEIAVAVEESLGQLLAVVDRANPPN